MVREALWAVLAAAAVTLLGIVWAVGRRRRPELDQVWAEAATSLGLVFDNSDGPKIFGTLAAQKVSIRVVSDRKLDDEIPCTFYHVAYARPLAFTLRACRRNKATRGAVHSTGDPDFDSFIQVTSSEPDLANNLLTSERKQALRQLFQALDTCMLDHLGIIWKRPGVESDRKVIEQVVRRMVDAATLLTEAR